MRLALIVLLSGGSRRPDIRVPDPKQPDDNDDEVEIIEDVVETVEVS